MGVKWRDFQMPKRLDCEETSYTNTYGKFVAEPFERGYGVTLGNSLRAVITTGDTSSAIRQLPRDPHLRFASKPVRADELLALLRALLAT